MNGIPVEAGEPKGAGDVSGGMTTATIGALGSAEVAVTFAASWAVDLMAA